jgi:hypothetical protein
MGAARESTQADFDLERFVDMFDEALTSRDERVVNALRSLMMMVILTKPEAKHPMADRARGPLRQVVEDQNIILRRLDRLEDELRQVKNSARGDMRGAGNWPNSISTNTMVWNTNYEDEFKTHLKDEYYRIMNQTPTGKV